LFISFPGDEEQFGGCLAAGRGFIHVNPGGDLEACPLAPFSDVNINETRLQEALASPLLKRIRENPQLLEETAGGCALFAKRETVSALIEKH
jgi:MoaA/NifB/PqqE/SkfB family radical SAM enzyme